MCTSFLGSSYPAFFYKIEVYNATMPLSLPFGRRLRGLKLLFVSSFHKYFSWSLSSLYLESPTSWVKEQIGLIRRCSWWSSRMSSIILTHIGADKVAPCDAFSQSALDSFPRCMMSFRASLYCEQPIAMMAR